MLKMFYIVVLSSCTNEEEDLDGKSRNKTSQDYSLEGEEKRLFVFKTLNNFYHLLNLMPTRLKLNFIEK